jgi:tetratricopeptide (TPR) repeat protein
MRVTTIAAALITLGVSFEALADDKAKAKALYDEGLRQYNVAEYDEAIRAWKQAYLLSKRPRLLFNIGQAYRLSGDCKQALTFYASYRREEAKADQQEDLIEAEKICNAKLAEKPAEPPPPQPQPQPSPTEPLAQGTPPPADRTTRTSGMRKAGIVVGLAGVVVGAAGLYFAVDAGSKSDELDEYRGEWGTDQVALDEAGKRSEKLAWGLGVGGIVAIGAGVALYVLGGPAAETSTVAVVPTRNGAHVAWSFTF